MIDVTQTMACIQCGACVSDCLSMEVDPLFIGPAALAKAYRFVGDPRDGQHERAPQGPRRGPARHLRLHALLQLHRGLPEGRRADEPDHAAAARSPSADHDIEDRNNGHRHEHGVRQEHRARTASCTRPTCCPTPTAASSTRARCPSCCARCRRSCKALQRRKVTPGKALLHPHKADEGRQADLRARRRQATSATSSTSTSWARRTSPSADEQPRTPPGHSGGQLEERSPNQ